MLSSDDSGMYASEPYMIRRNFRCVASTLVFENIKFERKASLAVIYIVISTHYCTFVVLLKHQTSTPQGLVQQRHGIHWKELLLWCSSI